MFCVTTDINWVLLKREHRCFIYPGLGKRNDVSAVRYRRMRGSALPYAKIQ